MKTRDFYFDLPEELIAQEPPKKRGESRLLVLDKNTNQITDSQIKNISDFVDKDTLIVFNNTKVRKARMYGLSNTGANVEFLLLEQKSDTDWLVMLSKSKKQKKGRTYTFPGNITGEIIEEINSNRIIRFNNKVDDFYLNEFGHIPLPPYIKREDSKSDSKRYQTVYSKEIGSVAAPTAGLHFTNEIINTIKEKGAEITYVTLHVGLGTFLPIRTDNITDHHMHEESYEISEDTASKINKAKRNGKKILAVGTTSVRTLESAGRTGTIEAGKKSTDIFISPGFEFKIVDSILTNFHTPESSLMVLVSAFAGLDNIKQTYQHGINEKYRFFSYGDAMLIK